VIQRVENLATRLGPARLRAVRLGLSLVGLAALPYIIIVNRDRSLFGFDAHAYWAVDLGNLYGASTGNTSDLDAFRYTPAAGQVFAVFHILPWELFFALWFAAMIAALIWLTGRDWLVLLAFPPIPLELYHGNIHLFLAVAIVLGFRYPIAWAFVLLTKVSPGVGLLWFAFRGEWRRFVVAVSATVAIAAVSFVIAPNLWRQYAQTMVDNLDYDPGHAYPIPIPLGLRLLASAGIVWWGARTDRRWTVPVAATLSLPIIWFHGLALLVAAIPLWRADRARQAAATEPSLGSGVPRRRVEVAQAASGRSSIGA
jgi:Glycosyltransferase family 87